MNVAATNDHVSTRKLAPESTYNFFVANLRPAKKGERRALKPAHQRKTLILAGRVTPGNMSKANELIKTTGSKTKAINHLLENYEK